MIYRDLIYRVSMAGQTEFVRALSSLHDLMKKAATEEVALAKTTANHRRKVKTDEQKHEESILKMQMAREKARYQQLQRDAARYEREAAKEKERGEKEKTKVSMREERERQRLAKDSLRESARARAEEARAYERAEREKTRIAIREARVRQKEQESIERSVMRAQAASSREMMRQRLQMQRASERDERDRMFDRKRLFRGIGTGVAEGAMGAVRSGYNIASGAARSIGGGMGIFGAFDIQDIVAERQQGMALLRSAAIEAREAGKSFGADFNEVEGYNKIRGVSRRFGMSQRDLFGAIDAASEKGSGADAIKNLDRIATQATAMGTDATTIAKMRAQLKMSAEVAGKPLNDDQIDKMMAKMHFIGKTGVFRAEDIAKESESLFSSFVKGGGDLESGFDRYITFANEARKSVGSGSMARTAIMGVQDAIAKKESRINALGVATRDKDGGQRDFIEVVMDVIQKTGAQGKAFNNIFDPSKSGKAIATMVSTYNDASHHGKDGAAGRAAMIKLLSGKDSIKDATVDEMNKDAELRMQSGGVRIQKAVETIRQALADKLTPVLEKIAEKAPEWAEKISKLLQWVTDHPYKAAGAAIAGNAVFGGMKAGALPLGAAALRFVGDRMAARVGGGGIGGALGAASGGLGRLLGSATATPVYVTGMAPGVGGFGGGGGGPGGGGGFSLPGLGGGGILGGSGGLAGASILGTVGGIAALTVAATGVSVALWELYKSTDHFKNKLDETANKNLKDKLDLEDAQARDITAEKLSNSLTGTKYAFQPGAKFRGGGTDEGGTGLVVQSREASGMADRTKTMAWKMVDESLSQEGARWSRYGGKNPFETKEAGKIDAALGVTAKGAQMVGPAIDKSKPFMDALQGMTDNVKKASSELDSLSRKAKDLGGSTSNFKAHPTTSFRF